MRYRRPPKTVKGKLPKVTWLSGIIKLVTHNLFPHDLDVHEDLHHLVTGAQQMTLITDSNSSRDDNEYDWDEEDLLEIGGELLSEDIPEWGLWGATWKSGRLLAAVTDPSTFDTPGFVAAGHAGATARRGHLTHNLPPLPHWSWLFDA
jgi:hypothetical protein